MSRLRLPLADPELFRSVAVDLNPPKTTTFQGPFGPVKQPTRHKVMYDYPNNYRGWRRMYRHHRYPGHRIIIVQHKWTFIPVMDEEYNEAVWHSILG